MKILAIEMPDEIYDAAIAALAWRANAQTTDPNELQAIAADQILANVRRVIERHQRAVFDHDADEDRKRIGRELAAALKAARDAITVRIGGTEIPRPTQFVEE